MKANKQFSVLADQNLLNILESAIENSNQISDDNSMSSETILRQAQAKKGTTSKLKGSDGYSLIQKLIDLELLRSTSMVNIKTLAISQRFIEVLPKGFTLYQMGLDIQKAEAISRLTVKSVKQFTSYFKTIENYKTKEKTELIDAFQAIVQQEPNIKRGLNDLVNSTIIAATDISKHNISYLESIRYDLTNEQLKIKKLLEKAKFKLIKTINPTNKYGLIDANNEPINDLINALIASNAYTAQGLIQKSKNKSELRKELKSQIDQLQASFTTIDANSNQAFFPILARLDSAWDYISTQISLQRDEKITYKRLLTSIDKLENDIALGIDIAFNQETSQLPKNDRYTSDESNLVVDLNIKDLDPITIYPLKNNVEAVESIIDDTQVLAMEQKIPDYIEILNYLDEITNPNGTIKFSSNLSIKHPIIMQWFINLTSIISEVKKQTNHYPTQINDQITQSTWEIINIIKKETIPNIEYTGDMTATFGLEFTIKSKSQL